MFRILVLVFISIASAVAPATREFKGLLAEDSDPLALHPPDNARQKFERAVFTGFYSNVDFAPVAALINAAKFSVDIEIYQMSDKSVLEAVRRALGLLSGVAWRVKRQRIGVFR